MKYSDEVLKKMDAEIEAIECCKKYITEHTDNLSNFINELSNCNGSIITVGVGKSEIIAKKIAATMSSLGVAAFSLNVLDALHGELNRVSNIDYLLFFSKSGETSEIIKIAKLLKSRNVSLFSITSKMNCSISKLCDNNIYMPIEKEIDALNLAPTISTSLHMMMGDIIASILSKNKNYTKKDFYNSHPSGYLGKILSEDDLE